MAALLASRRRCSPAAALLAESGTSAARPAAAVTPRAAGGSASRRPPRSRRTTWQLFRSIGAQYKVPWVILAGIGKVESDDGQSTLPGVHSGANAFGAAGPMQIGIGGAAGNQWGGAPVHPASQKVDGIATDANGDGVASVYEPADAIAGAAKYLLAAWRPGQSRPGDLRLQPPRVLRPGGAVLGRDLYARAGTPSALSPLDSAPQCLPGVGQTPDAGSRHRHRLRRAADRQALPVGRHRPGRLRLLGSGDDGLPGGRRVDIPRTSEEQWTWGPRVSPGQVQPGDLVFFAGADGTPTAPGHVGLVIGGGTDDRGFCHRIPDQGRALR